MARTKDKFNPDTWTTEDLLLIWEHNGYWLQQAALYTDFRNLDGVGNLWNQWQMQTRIFNELIKRHAL